MSSKVKYLLYSNSIAGVRRLTTRNLCRRRQRPPDHGHQRRQPPEWFHDPAGDLLHEHRMRRPAPRSRPPPRQPPAADPTMGPVRAPARTAFSPQRRQNHPAQTRLHLRRRWPTDRHPRQPPWAAVLPLRPAGPSSLQTLQRPPPEPKRSRLAVEPQRTGAQTARTGVRLHLVRLGRRHPRLGEQPRAGRWRGKTVHYLYEPGTFVPVAQALRHQPMRLLAQPSYTGAYDIDQDPLWTHTPQALPIDVLAWYQCDHLGTPQELTDPTGQIAWSAQYKAWGEVKEQRSEWAQRQSLTNPIRFQGQYHDHETGLHYNRYRYYDPRVGRFVSKDPISYAGGLNLYAYAPNPVEWIDALGLARKCQLGTYGSLTGKANTGDSLDAHEFIRNDALEQMRLTPEGTRNKSNPSIAIPRSMHTDIHRNENVLAALHLNVGRDQFQFGPNGLPSKRQMDVWQGALRTSGNPASRARELRKQAEGFLATCPCLCN